MRRFVISLCIALMLGVATYFIVGALQDLYWQDVYERCSALGGHVEHLRRGFLCLAPDGSSAW